MFGRYFADRYFPIRYFPSGHLFGTTFHDAPYWGRGYFPPHYFADRYFKHGGAATGGVGCVTIFDPAIFDKHIFHICPEEIVSVRTITDTDILEEPINCVLMGQQLHREWYRENTIVPKRQTESMAVKKSQLKRLKGKPPSFTTKTDKKGYD